MSCNHDCNQGRSCDCAGKITLLAEEPDEWLPADAQVLVCVVVACAAWFVFGMIGIGTVVGWVLK